MADPLALALEQLGHAGRDAALTTLDQAAADDPLSAAVARHLRTAPEGSVYTTPDGFRAFVDNGSNVELYADVIAELRSVHDHLRPSSIVDLGAGDGRVTAAVVHPEVRSIDIIEPADDLLASALDRADWPVPPTAHHTTMQEWAATRASGSHYELIQTTFALHTIEPEHRVPLLEALRPLAGELLVVDFDVPDFADGGADHAAHVAERYRRATAEYRDHPRAIDGFLLPVMVGQFDPLVERATFEQSVVRWRHDVEAAGFSVTSQIIHHYWWSDAFLLRAR